MLRNLIEELGALLALGAFVFMLAVWALAF